MPSGSPPATSTDVAVACARGRGRLGYVLFGAAAEYASQGVRVNVISPGAIETPMLAANLAAGSAEERDAIMARDLSMIDSRRLGMPEELAAAVVWLASDQASYVVGHNLVVDGGIRGD